MKKDADDAQACQKIDKAARFERLAERRVNEALEKLRLVANLSNRRNYTYSAEHAQQIVLALESGFQKLREKFQDAAENREIRFSFKENEVETRKYGGIDF
jgi:ADP-dependent phosphofructokinase/glucokinase